MTLSQLTDAFRARLKRGLKERDQVAVAAVRSVLAALDNAQAVSALGTEVETVITESFAGVSLGVGSSEVERRVLGVSEVAGVIEGEIAEREAAAQQYAAAGYDDHAEQLRAEVAVIREVLAG